MKALNTKKKESIDEWYEDQSNQRFSLHPSGTAFHSAVPVVWWLHSLVPSELLYKRWDPNSKSPIPLKCTERAISIQTHSPALKVIVTDGSIQRRSSRMDGHTWAGKPLPFLSAGSETPTNVPQAHLHPRDAGPRSGSSAASASQGAAEPPRRCQPEKQ